MKNDEQALIRNIRISGPTIKEVSGILVSKDDDGNLDLSCRKKYSKSTFNEYITYDQVLLSVGSNIGEETTVFRRGFCPILETKGRVVVQENGLSSVVDEEGRVITFNTSLMNQLGYMLSISSDPLTSKETEPTPAVKNGSAKEVTKYTSVTTETSSFDDFDDQETHAPKQPEKSKRKPSEKIEPSTDVEITDLDLGGTEREETTKVVTQKGTDAAKERKPRKPKVTAPPVDAFDEGEDPVENGVGDSFDDYDDLPAVKDTKKKGPKVTEPPEDNFDEDEEAPVVKETKTGKPKVTAPPVDDFDEDEAPVIKGTKKPKATEPPEDEDGYYVDESPVIKDTKSKGPKVTEPPVDDLDDLEFDDDVLEDSASGDEPESDDKDWDEDATNTDEPYTDDDREDDEAEYTDEFDEAYTEEEELSEDDFDTDGDDEVENPLPPKGKTSSRSK